jgi:hypothetical protein
MVNIDVNRSLGTIVKYLLIFDIASLISFIFVFNKTFVIVSVIFNIFMLSLYKIFVKYEYMISGLIKVNKFARSVDNIAKTING